MPSTAACRTTRGRPICGRRSTGCAPGSLSSPLDPYAWADLALSLWLAGAPTAEAAQALERSLATGPAERNLLPLRVRLINALGPYLSEEGRSLADRERALARRTSSSLRRLLNP